MRNLTAIRQAWLLTCVVGAVLAPIVPTFVAAGVILVGLILVVHARDQRDPTLSLFTAAREYVRTHEWTMTMRIAGYMAAVWCVSLISDQNSRGVYLACLGVHWMFESALPVRDERAEATPNS